MSDSKHLLFQFNEYFEYENTLFDLLYYTISSLFLIHVVFTIYDSAAIMLVGNCQLIIFTEG